MKIYLSELDPVVVKDNHFENNHPEFAVELVQSRVLENKKNGKYRSKIPFPPKESGYKISDAARDQFDKIDEDRARLQLVFRDDCFEEFGLSNNSNKLKYWEFVQQHASDYDPDAEYNLLKDLVDILKLTDNEIKK